MPFLLRNLPLLPDEDEELLLNRTASATGLRKEQIKRFRIVRKSVDSRRKPRIFFVCTVLFFLDDETILDPSAASIPNLEKVQEEIPTVFSKAKHPGLIVIAGMGPAGLFCALRLAAYGVPSVLLERGRPVEERIRDVSRFWANGILSPESNVQFGEGGAGTFSDGKLTCRLRDPNTGWVLEQLISFGAPPEIRFQAKPHVGTDRLRGVVAAMRQVLLERGCRIHFNTCLTALGISRGKIMSAICRNGHEFDCQHLVIATGHSARDTYKMLCSHRLCMEPKPFAIGLRVEHQQELIDRIQYGRPSPSLPKADYALTYNNTATGRSCYSFCMCPGGVVIGSSSEPEMLVVNGMSNQRRDSGLANSALVVNVRPEDFGATDPLAGIRFQQQWERTAFIAGGGDYQAPSQNLLAFLGQGSGPCISSFMPGCREADLSALLPEYVSETLREGIATFGRKMRGFVTADATLTGVETRTSAPLRILRGEDLHSPGVQGLYPCGEGAGYAGGIMSAALDGVKVADRIVSSSTEMKS